jgi:hypothetical protein
MELSLRSRALWVFSTALLCIGCDQATKLAARSWLSVGEVDSLLGDTVRRTRCMATSCSLAPATSL